MNEWWADEPHERQPLFEQRYPGRIKAELDQLAQYCTVVEVRRDCWEVGLFAVETQWLHDGKAYGLRIIYPAAFPRVRPAIFLQGDRSLFPRRHCDPIDGALCYLGQSEHQWRPQDSLGRLIKEQLPKILDVSFTSEEEDPVPEPAERWWNVFALENSAILFDSRWSTGAADRGTLKIAYRVLGSPYGAVRCVVTNIHDARGNELARWDGALPLEFRTCKAMDIPWVRAGDELFPNNPDAVLKAFAPRFGKQLEPRALGEKLVGFMFAIVHPTELEYGVEGDSWLTFMSFGSWKDFKRPNREGTRAVTVRTLRAGSDDLLSRSPASKVFLGRKIVVAGAGAIGAPIAIELARNGVAKLTIVDHDRLMPGNSVRWPLGELYWGVGKPEALSEFIEANYSRCQMQALRFDVGEHLGLRRADSEALMAAIREADLVIDATTSFGVLGALYDFCTELEIPLLSASATPAVKGGTVVYHATQGGCPTCLLFHYNDGAFAPPAGEGESGESVTPIGCSQVTFSGTSFDLQEMSLQAMRVAVHVLKENPNPASSVVYRLDFEDDRFGRTPSWTAADFPKHKSCSCSL